MVNVDRPHDLPNDASRLGDWRWFVVYAVLSLIIQWPLVGSLTTHISYGHETEITVPLLNLWTVWWNADRAAHWFYGYWDAPIFYPTHRTFLFSEAQPTSLIVAPIFALTGNRALTYNLYQLLILTINGYSAHRLLRRVGHITWLAFCGGVMSQILPFIMWQFGVVQLTTLFGIHWTLHAVLDLFDTANPRTFDNDENDGPPQDSDDATDPTRTGRFWLPVGVRLGFVYGITYWLCNYWGLFLTLVLVPSSIWFWNRRLLSKSLWTQLLWAMLVAVVMIGPIALMQRSLSQRHDWISSRSSETVRDLSAHWRDYTDVPWRNLVPWLEFPEKSQDFPERSRENVWTLGPGGLKLLLAPIGLIASLTCPRRRRWGAFAATFGAIAFGLSSGPVIHFASGIPLLAGVSPYERMQELVPGFSLIRSPFRFSLFVQLAAVWLTIEALDLMNPLRWLTRPLLDPETGLRRLPQVLNPLFGLDRDERLRILIQFPLVLLSVVVTLEAVPPTTPLYELPSKDGIPIWVQWLRDHAEPDQGVACLPFPTGDTVGDYEDAAVLMYWGTFHRRSLVNGYSGFFPVSYCELKQGLEQFQRPADLNPGDVYQPKFADYSPDNPGLKLLNEGSIRYVVVKRSFGTRDDVWVNSATRLQWELVASDETAAVDIYRLPIKDR